MKFNRFILTTLSTFSLILIGFNTPLLNNQAVWTPGVMLAQASNPAISTNIIYYDIEGSTAAELRSQMNQKGRFDSRLGRRYDGYTQWRINWHYTYLNSNKQCRINSVDVKTNINITLPRWKIPKNASKELINRWNRYIAALELHENGHKQHGIDASNELLQSLKRLPATVNCDRMNTSIKEVSDRIVKKYNQQDIAYDQTTRHGATQGAVFP